MVNRRTLIREVLDSILTGAAFQAQNRFKSDRLFFVVVFIFSLTSLSRLFQLIETGQSVGGAKTGEPREKPPDTPAIRAWLVSHVARAGLEPTQDTAVR